MRVASVSFDVLEVPLRTSLATASGDWAVVRLGLLSLRTDTGLTGLGEAALDGHAMRGTMEADPRGSRAALSNAVLQALTGVDLADAGAVEERLTAIDAWPGCREGPSLGRRHRPSGCPGPNGRPLGGGLAR